MVAQGLSAQCARCARVDRTWGERGMVQERSALTFVLRWTSCASSERSMRSAANLIMSTDGSCAPRPGASTR
eukprot:7388436-Prymnesium_polylepis.1